MFNPRILARVLLTFIAALFIAAADVTCLISQATNATVLGTVKDSVGAVMMGVSVRIKNIDTDVTQSAVTNGSGQFRVGNLPVGTYEVEAAVAGFKTIIRRPVILGVSGSVTVDFSLEVGPSEETVFVDAAVPLVETHSPALSSISTFDEKQLGRNLGELVTMNPGVAATMLDMPAVGNLGMGRNMMLTIYGTGENHSVSGSRAEG
jgi:Carboxypeptidase regulatory-like domain